jgi:hypothetical protein
MIEECASTSEEVTMPTKRMRTALLAIALPVRRNLRDSDIAISSLSWITR